MAFIVTVMLFQQTAIAEELIFTDLPISLKIGDTASIDSDFTMTLLGVEDSRCPVDVVCIWQGTVTAKVKLEKERKDLGDYPIPLNAIEGTEQTFEGHYIRLTNVEPYPENTNPINETDYSLIFFVSKAKSDSIDSPLKQFNNGIPFSEIKCRDNLRLTQKYDGMPACVTDVTYDKLIERYWVSDIIRAVQSKDLSEPDQSDIQPIIKTGTNAGFCIGYCSKEFEITPEKITYTQGGRDVSEISKEVPFSESSWDTLKNLVDFEKFNSLPENIGCPGCADAPVEFIEITKGNTTKRIHFETIYDVPEIKELVLELHKIRGPIESTIESFEECVAAGNPIMESHPMQCMTEDGKNFVEKVDIKLDLTEQCTVFGGKWLAEFNECEDISESQCSEMNGLFKECESACRHDPDAEMCTMQCVLVCEIP